MRVAINTLSHVAGGSITYLKNMLPHFAADGNEYVVFVPEDREALREPDADNIEFYTVRFPTDGLPLRMIYEQVVFPVVLARESVDVLFSPGDITTLFAPCHIVLAVRNPNPYFDVTQTDESITRNVKLRVQRLLTRLSSRRADRVFFVSEFQRTHTQPILGVSDEKVRVIHHGIDNSIFGDVTETPSPELEQTLATCRPYILSISTINPHKNFETLLRGYAALPATVRDRYDLVIAGRISAPEYYERLQAIAEAEGIAADVCFLGEVPYEVVPFLYDDAELFVLPSELETFGHTLVESMSSGLPVVAADATCIPEITAGAAALFDPTDPGALSEAIVSVLEDDTERRRMIERGLERANDFSWRRTANQTRALFEEAASSQ